MAINDRAVLQSVFVNPASSGSNEILAAVAGLSYKVYGFFIVSTLANSVKFLSAATAISATLPLAANGGLVVPPGDSPWCKTVAGEALNINLSVSTATGVHVLYEVYHG